MIEETRKYRDSDGREETEIITREPSPEDNIQPVEPFTGIITIISISSIIVQIKFLSVWRPS